MQKVRRIAILVGLILFIFPVHQAGSHDITKSIDIKFAVKPPPSGAGYDTGWVPDNSPIQVKSAIGISMDRIETELPGKAFVRETDSIEHKFSVQGRSGGYLLMDGGLQFQVLLFRFNTPFGSWEGSLIPKLPSLDLHWYDKKNFTPFLLEGDSERPVNLHDTFGDSFDIGFSPIPFADAGVTCIIEGDVKCTLEGEKITADGAIITREGAEGDVSDSDLNIEYTEDFTRSFGVTLKPGAFVQILGARWDFAPFPIEFELIPPTQVNLPFNTERVTLPSWPWHTIQDTVAITSGPTANPNLITSGGTTNLSVTATDSYGHSVNYSWTVSPNEGSFSPNPNTQNPTWTTPKNNTCADKTYTFTATATCSVNSNVKDTGTVQVIVKTVYGDVSGDGDITAYDASLVLKVVVGLILIGDSKYPSLSMETADVTGNKTISALDAALILQYSVGLITRFPVDSASVAPALNPKNEKQVLAEAIVQLENIPPSKEQKKVLEQLKRLMSRQLLPKHTALLQNYPNPFNPDTWLPYQLATDAPVTISIYNTRGQLICTLHLGNQKAGVYVTKNKAAYWDGKDSLGQSVTSGVYFYSIQAASFMATRKMVIVK